jgi:hypothetical protein
MFLHVLFQVSFGRWCCEEIISGYFLYLETYPSPSMYPLRGDIPFSVAVYCGRMSDSRKEYHFRRYKC